MNRACGHGCVNYIINSVVGCHDEAASGDYVVLMHLIAMVMESVLIASQVQATRASSLISWPACRVHSAETRGGLIGGTGNGVALFIEVRSVRDRLGAEPGFSDFPGRDLVYSMLRSLIREFGSRAARNIKRRVPWKTLNITVSWYPLYL
jgi:hypothetical protein